MSLRITAAQQRHASIQGFVTALTRLDDAEGLRPTFIALSEALYWAITIEDDVRKEAWYEERRAASEDWGVIPGIRYARNFATHQVVALTEHVGGLTIPFTVPFSIPPIRLLWLGYEELPPPGKPSKFTPSQQASYRDHLSGQPTIDTLLRVQAWLRSLQDVALQ